MSTYVCPECGEEVQEETICPQCGYDPNDPKPAKEDEGAGEDEKENGDEGTKRST